MGKNIRRKTLIWHMVGEMDAQTVDFTKACQHYPRKFDFGYSFNSIIFLPF